MIERPPSEKHDRHVSEPRAPETGRMDRPRRTDPSLKNDVEVGVALGGKPEADHPPRRSRTTCARSSSPSKEHWTAQRDADGTIRVGVQCERTGRGIRVDDNGPGVPDEMRERGDISRRRQRHTPELRTQGTGMPSHGRRET